MYVMELTKEISGGRRLKHSDGSPVCSENGREHSPPDTEQVRDEQSKEIRETRGPQIWSGLVILPQWGLSAFYILSLPYLV